MISSKVDHDSRLSKVYRVAASSSVFSVSDELGLKKKSFPFWLF